MAITVKPIELWRKEIENRPGTLAEVLEPVRNVDLRIVMLYRYPNNKSKGAVELYPISSKKAAQAAKAAGLSSSSIPALLVEGDNKAGLSHGISKALADAGINLAFLVGQVVGKKYSIVMGFDSGGDARRAAPLIKRAAPIIGRIARTK
jgi:hypothetical protein